MESTCQSDMCHMTLTSFVRSMNNVHQVFSFTTTIQHMLTLVGRPIADGGNMSTRNHQLTLIWLSSSAIFMIRSFFLFPYNVGSRYVVHTLIMEGSYWWNWSHHFNSIRLATMTWLTVAKHVCHKLQWICWVCRNHNPFFSHWWPGLKQD